MESLPTGWPSNWLTNWPTGAFGAELRWGQLPALESVWVSGYLTNESIAVNGESSPLSQAT